MKALITIIYLIGCVTAYGQDTPFYSHIEVGGLKEREVNRIIIKGNDGVFVRVNYDMEVVLTTDSLTAIKSLIDYIYNEGQKHTQTIYKCDRCRKNYVEAKTEPLFD